MESHYRLIALAVGLHLTSTCWAEPSAERPDVKLPYRHVHAAMRELPKTSASLRSELIDAGYLVDSKRPRLSLPLASFAGGGPKLLLTYNPKYAPGTGNRGVACVLQMSLK